MTNIHIKDTMTIPQGTRAQTERALALHHARCPASQSTERGIRIEWSAEISEI